MGEGDGRRFGNSVLDALQRGMNHVIIDCREWHRLDLNLLSALVRCANAFANHGATLEFANLSPEMRAIVRELRLQNRLRFWTDFERERSWREGRVRLLLLRPSDRQITGD